MPSLSNAQLTIAAIGTLFGTSGLATPKADLNFSQITPLGSGTGANQADKMYAATRTLALSTGEDLDLAGTLTDAFGAVITFARIKAMIFRAAVGNTNNVIVGNAASNGFISWCGSATDKVTVRPGGTFALIAPDATAYAVTPATADLLHVLNGGAGTPVTYDVVILGSSA
jgi:hypothetical protein